MGITFNASESPTLGVEVELQVVDLESRLLVAGAPAILDKCGGDSSKGLFGKKSAGQVKPELLQSTVEINTGVCRDIGEVRRDLSEHLGRIQEACDSLGYGLVSAGTHPTAMWADQSITDEDRYWTLVDRCQWPAKRLLIFGLHVHIGIASREKAIAIFNSLTTFLPHFLSLSASSPFWAGDDTGLASARVKVFETLPTAGLPYRLLNWGEFQQLMNTLIKAGAIESIREIWWDIRPHPGFGTVELRICDGPSTLSEIVALAALMQAVVVWLGKQYDEGIGLPILRHWIVRENKWRAARWATDAQIIVDNEGNQEGLSDVISNLIDEVSSIGRELNCSAELEAAKSMLTKPLSYQRQRAIFKESGDLKMVVDGLLAELRTDQPTAVA